MEKAKNKIVQTITWRGIRMEITHVGTYSAGMDHIEIHTENKTPIPITETGYKSHFFPTGSYAEYDTAEAFVVAWLEAEADSKEWVAKELAAQQMSLF